MAEDKLSVIYSENAIANSLTIKNFLLFKFSQREVNNFYKLLEKFEQTVAIFPEAFPKTTIRVNARRAVLSKQLSVIYIIYSEQISVAGIVDSRMDYDKWPS